MAIKTVWVGAALAALALASVAVLLWAQTGANLKLPAIAGIGGSFALVDHRGNAVTENDLLGKPSLIFFGFTHCPDVCPTTLFELSNFLKELGPEADRLNVLFITVDPDRDTPEQLALYLSSFDPRIIGLSGTTEKIAAVMRAYRVYARKVSLDGGGYTMDHTATVYMLNGDGKCVGVMSYQEPEAAARAKIRRLIDLGGRP